MYTVQTRWIVKKGGENRQYYLKRQCPTRQSVVKWIYQMSDKPEARHIYITAWDSGNDVIYYRKDDDIEMYDALGDTVDRLEDIGRLRG